MKKLIKILLVVLISSTLFFDSKSHICAKVDMDGMKNTIVEIYAGVENDDGNFVRVKNTSGFLISNDDYGAYIITTNHSVTLSEKEMGSVSDATNPKTSLRVIIKGDVSSELSIIAQSSNKDFCILKADTVIQEKEVLKLSTQDVEIGDTVYTLGYSQDLVDIDSAQYDKNDVTVESGQIINSSFDESRASYLQHTSTVDSGNSGGPLLNEDGYVIGLNNSKLCDSDNKIYYSLTIQEIIDVLDNYGIEYGSYELDQTYSELNELYDECNELITNNSYSSASLGVMNEAIESYRQFITTDSMDVDEVTDMIETLQEAKEQLVEKRPIVLNVIYVLAGVIVLLFIYLMRLLWQNKRIPIKKSQSKAVEPKQTMVKQETVIKEKVINSSTTSIIDTDEDYEDKTILLSQYDNKKVINNHSLSLSAYLIIKRLGISKDVIKPIMIIGKNPDLVDLAITDNKTISRRHAKICYSNNVYMLYDLNSANGTYVNDQKIDEKGHILQDGDIIRISDEIIEFKEKEGIKNE